MRLLRFDRPQIQAFLTRWTGSEEEALRRMELLEDVKDLMGLSENPRMLSFIAELDRADLEKAKGADGKVTSAALYRVLIERWLDFEIHRIEPRGAAPGLPLAARWDAVSVLARHLWEKPEPTIRLSEVSERIADTIASLPHLEPESATHQVASGTLLVRDAEGNFSLVHQSVLEWLVANNTTNELRAGMIPRALTVKDMSRLMVDFFIDLGGEEAIAWARGVASAESPDPVAKKNAVNVLGRLPKDKHPPVGAVSTPAVLGAVDPVTRRVAVMEDDASVSVFSYEGMREFTYQLGRITEQIALQGDFPALTELSVVAIVDVQKGRLLHSLEALGGDVTALAFQPGSDVLWTAHDHYTRRGTLRRIHARNGTVGLARTLDFEPRRLSVARDGSVAAAARGIVEIHRTRGDKAECLYSEGEVDEVFLSEDGGWLVTWSFTEIRIRNGFTNEPLFVVPAQMPITKVALSPDERVLTVCPGTAPS